MAANCLVYFNQIICLTLTVMLMIASGCSQEKESDGQGSKDKTTTSEGGEDKQSTPTPSPDVSGATVTSHVTCNRPEDAPSSLVNISDLVSLINSLPKPVSLPCLLDVLPRPLKINATASKLSIQPAGGSANPRIFIFYGDLILAMVPAGTSARVLEMSELLNDVYSVKGELAIPVTSTLANDAPYTQIIRQDGIDGTTCAGCHGSETHPTDFIDGAFASIAFKPIASNNVSVVELVEMRDACGDLVDERCNFLRALFGGDDTSVQEKQFPTAMPTMF